MRKTVKEQVLESIILHYPIIKTHLLHNASEEHPYSTMQRLRELRQAGIDYTFNKKNMEYDFSCTPISLIHRLAGF